MGARSQNDAAINEVQPGVWVCAEPVPVYYQLTWSESEHSEQQMIHLECDCIALRADKESVVEKTLSVSRKTSDSQHGIFKQNQILLHSAD